MHCCLQTPLANPFRRKAKEREKVRSTSRETDQERQGHLERRDLLENTSEEGRERESRKEINDGRN